MKFQILIAYALKSPLNAHADVHSKARGLNFGLTESLLHVCLQERVWQVCEANLTLYFCLFDLILYVPSTIFQLNRDGSSWVEPVLS